MERQAAVRAAHTVLSLLAPVCQRSDIAGSVRRGKPEVKDIELVVMPAFGFRHTLHKYIQAGPLSWAVYWDKHGRKSYRQGDKYMGVMLGEARVEIFTADKDNWGYLFWLRTGPADANAWLMTYLKHHTAPFELKGGYVWQRGKRLHVPEESVFFQLLGMDTLEPAERSEQAYRQQLSKTNHRWGHAPVSQQSSQLELF